MTVRPIFLPTVPDRNPRTECGCQPVAFINSLPVTPPGRFSRSRTLAVLLPSRAPLAFLAPLGAFLAGEAFFPDWASLGVPFAPCAPAAALLVALGSMAVAAGAVSVSMVDVM